MTRAGGRVAGAALAAVWAACGSTAQPHIERDDDAGPGVVIVKRTAGGVRLAEEVEPNDAAGHGQPLSPPGGVTATLASAADVDRVAVAADRAGWLAVAAAAPEGIDLVVELVGPGGALLARSDRGGAGVAEGMPNYPVEPGRYEVVVREYAPKRRRRKAPRTTPSPPYTLAVRWAPEPTELFEREPNAAERYARPVAIGGEVRGYIGWEGDKDRWLVPIDGAEPDEAVDIDVDGVDGVALQVAVSRAGSPVLQRAGAPGQALAIRSLALEAAGESPAPLALALTGKRSSFDEPYALRVSIRPLPYDAEAEPNDAPAQATPLAVEPGRSAGARRGALTPGDVDLYAVPVADARQQLDVAVEPASPGLDVAVALVLADGTVLGEADAGGPGAPDKLAGAGILPGARAFVRVQRKPGDASAADDVAPGYTVRWSLGAGGAIPRALVE
ncbi:MAG: hypothetical protein D6689_03030 [Deltaproteobacteria bacterium]|nr:MAG: hypothetical protein D6689_03030 [Deltaproteobacteria bacterium]